MYLTCIWFVFCALCTCLYLDHDYSCSVKTQLYLGLPIIISGTDFIYYILIKNYKSSKSKNTNTFTQFVKNCPLTYIYETLNIGNGNHYRNYIMFLRLQAKPGKDKCTSYIGHASQ